MKKGLPLIMLLILVIGQSAQAQSEFLDNKFKESTVDEDDTDTEEPSDTAEKPDTTDTQVKNPVATVTQAKSRPAVAVPLIIQGNTIQASGLKEHGFTGILWDHAGNKQTGIIANNIITSSQGAGQPGMNLSKGIDFAGSDTATTKDSRHWLNVFNNTIDVGASMSALSSAFYFTDAAEISAPLIFNNIFRANSCAVRKSGTGKFPALSNNFLMGVKTAPEMITPCAVTDADSKILAVSNTLKDATDTQSVYQPQTYKLIAGSTAIDKGDLRIKDFKSYIGLPDREKNTRPCGAGVDMGAYELCPQK